jgi:predicted nucleic acid-binding protein
MIRRIYIDTSVFGGYFDIEFEKETKPFFERIFENQIKIIVSEILELELYRAPDYIQDFFESILSACKKTSSSRLAKSEKAEFTNVNEHFSDECNAEIGVFLQTLPNNLIERI